MKLYQRIIAGGLVIVLSAGGTLLYADNRAAAKDTPVVNVGIDPEKEAASQKFPIKTESNLETEKKEIVYVFTGEDGTKQKVLVTDTITNPDALSSLADKTNLTDIVNVKGNESFSLNGTDLTWQADGKDICYQGTTSEEVPVSVHITYYLDGKEISAAELAGKSGKVTIRFDYSNQLTRKVEIGGEAKDVAVPFAMVTAVLLDTDKFTNIEVTNGKLISEGNISAAVLVGLPGVAESLGMDEEYAMDYAEITADMVDFSLNNTFTVATNSIFSKLDLKDDMDLDSLSDALKQLEDATNELVQGTADLYEGAGALKDGVKTLTNGIEELSEGSAALSDNMSVLAEGARGLMAGAKTLTDSIALFQNGLKSAKEGSQALSEGCGTLQAGAAAFGEGLTAAGTGVSQLAEGSESLKNGAAQVEAGAKSLNEGLASLSTGLSGLDQGIDTVYTSLNATITYNEQVLAGLTQIYEGYGEMLDKDTRASLQTMIGTLTQTIGAQKQLAGSMTAEGDLKSGVTQLIAGAGALTSGAAELEEGSGSVAEGAERLDAGIDGLAENMPQLSAGYGSICEGIDNLSAGADTLNSGLSGLVTAGGQLMAGSSELYDGTVTLSSGADALYEGSVSLKDGIGSLKEGAGELAEGVDTLYEGTETLKDGMSRYSEEGIGKLTDALDGDLQKVYESLKAMVDASADYRSFTGISEEMEGSVAFIIRTSEVK